MNIFHKCLWTISSLKEKQVEQSSDYGCVLVRTCTSTFTCNFFSHCFVLLLLKCSLNILAFTFHTLTCLYFAQNRHFFMISTRLWLMDGRTDTPSYRDARTHLKRMKTLRAFNRGIQGQPEMSVHSPIDEKKISYEWHYLQRHCTWTCRMRRAL